MAAPIGGYICNYILVKFNSPDGSTCCCLKYDNILVNFDHPDGSTSWDYMLLYLVKFDFPDGSTN